MSEDKLPEDKAYRSSGDKCQFRVIILEGIPARGCGIEDIMKARLTLK